MWSRVLFPKLRGGPCPLIAVHRRDRFHRLFMTNVAAGVGTSLALINGLARNVSFGREIPMYLTLLTALSVAVACVSWKVTECHVRGMSEIEAFQLGAITFAAFLAQASCLVWGGLVIRGFDRDGKIVGYDVYFWLHTNRWMADAVVYCSILYALNTAYLFYTWTLFIIIGVVEQLHSAHNNIAPRKRDCLELPGS